MVNSTMQVGIAGRDISCYLWLLLHKEGADFHASAKSQVVQTIKEQTCYLSISSQNVPGKSFSTFCNLLIQFLMLC